ncbi:ABC transporter ATP-binding protein [Qingshengfaniella alkalisoli]|uniref:ABC transporter ATP-binding protein n=1 Tax=Qingshengfaniella alkalisoli TaxID=2599296 RepID=A0A5B8J139_9RHOB|nr:ABC transporter ATP-binding protein [Qingshengfaniella alkalisoli]QDY70588.1 ABC transporter ATP-binding protein [Qingshengfaniella alkalisoli]
MSLILENVVKKFDGTTVVNSVTARLTDGEFFVVLGPSGCGKSTLLRLIAGLEQVDEGKIALNGAQVSGVDRHVPPEQRQAGVVFQSYALWPHMTVRQNVAFPAEAAGMGRAQIADIVENSLNTVDLMPFADRLPASLSGGQRQRVALARCLAGGARTVLMDEPLANLDPHLRGRMEAEIRRFHKDAGVTTLYITHDQREAMALADQIAVMWGGRFLQIASPQDIHDRPATEEVARFIGRAAVLAGTVKENRADLGPVSVPLDRGRNGPARVVIRPGDVRLGQGVPARLEDVFYRGGSWEAMACVEGLAERVPIASSQVLRSGELVQVTLTGGWILPN